MAPKPLRIEAWRRLARDLDKDKLRGHHHDPARADVLPSSRPKSLAGKIRGRVVLEVG